MTCSAEKLYPDDASYTLPGREPPLFGHRPSGAGFGTSGWFCSCCTPPEFQFGGSRLRRRWGTPKEAPPHPQGGQN